MDSKDENTKVVRESVKADQILPERIHIRQFLISHPELDAMQQVGFKALCGKEWMRPDEWEEQLRKYLPPKKEEKE